MTASEIAAAHEAGHLVLVCRNAHRWVTVKRDNGDHWLPLGRDCPECGRVYLYIEKLEVPPTKPYMPHLDVLEFHKKYSYYYGDKPSFPAYDEMMHRLALITEEYLEVCRSLGIDCIVSPLPQKVHSLELDAIIQELIDLRTVVDGTLLAFGCKDIIPELHAEVFRANMEKTPPTEPRGRATKPEGWKPPDIKGIIARAQK